MEQKTHFFFALKLPESTKLMLKQHGETIKRSLPFKRWVHHEDLHITLAFLGFAPAEKLKAAVKKVEGNITDAKPFTLKIDRLGIFGKQDHPRILFSDTEESNELQLVRQKVFSACEDAGFKLETRPFRPHITLARKWIGDEPFQKEMLDVWNQFQQDPIAFKASEISLYQTHLDRSPKYETIRLFSLDNSQ
jgi:2'-5' RNA ligase